MNAVDEVLTAALELPEEDRARVAHALLCSLDGPGAESEGEAWVAELERRAREVADGTAKLEPWSDVRQRIEARLRIAR